MKSGEVLAVVPFTHRQCPKRARDPATLLEVM